MKTLEDEWYIAMKAYKFFCFRKKNYIIIYACPYYPYVHIESTDSMICRVSVLS